MHWEKRQKFSIRKFSIGAASVLIGQFFVGQNLGDQVVAADEVAGLVEDSSPVSSESSPTAEREATSGIESANIGGGVPLGQPIAQQAQEKTKRCRQQMLERLFLLVRQKQTVQRQVQKPLRLLKQQTFLKQKQK